MDQGTWTMDVQGRVTICIPGRLDEVLEIVSLDSNRMVLKKQ
jgi:hypothetical protein